MKFLCLFTMALAIGHFSLTWLTVLCLVICSIVSMVSLKSFALMLRRIRWLLCVLLGIYAFTTPGQYIHHAYSITYEGVDLGVRQALKIITMLAGLSLILSTTSRDALIGGLFQIMRPLQVLKIDAKKFAARLWLTLHYVESKDIKMHRSFSWMSMLQDDSSFELNSNLTHLNEVTIKLETLNNYDYAVLALIFIGISYVWAL